MQFQTFHCIKQQCTCTYYLHLHDFEYSNIIVSPYSLTCLLCARSNGDFPNCIVNEISNV